MRSFVAIFLCLQAGLLIGICNAATAPTTPASSTPPTSTLPPNTPPPVTGSATTPPPSVPNNGSSSNATNQLDTTEIVAMETGTDMPATIVLETEETVTELMTGTLSGATEMPADATSTNPTSAAPGTVGSTPKPATELTTVASGTKTTPPAQTEATSTSAPVQTPQKTSEPTEPVKVPTEPVKIPTEGSKSTAESTTENGKPDVSPVHGSNTSSIIVGLVVTALLIVLIVGVFVYFRQKRLRNNYGRLSEDTEDSGWSAFSKNPIYRGDRNEPYL